MKALFLAVVFNCVAASSGQPAPENEVAPGVRRSGLISHPDIRESSGLVASRRYADTFWTHNDKGSARQMLYAIRRNGESLAEFLITGTRMGDWEDIAIDSGGHLFLGDIGNNDAKRTEIAVHEISEPDPKAARRSVPITRSWRLRFPKKPFDCESLFVIGTNGFVISKVFNDARAAVYRFPLTDQTGPTVLEFVAETKIESPVTGADVSADGRLLGIVAKSGAFAYRINGDPARITRAKLHQTKFKHDHIEACAFVPEGLLATAESREVFLFTDSAFQTAR